MPQPKNNTLAASYQSPTNEPFTISKDIPAPPSTSVTDKTAYLEALRQALSSTQDQINKELTARMEEDKAREAKVGGSKKSVDDVKEEENYGEEMQEED